MFSKYFSLLVIFVVLPGIFTQLEEDEEEDDFPVPDYIYQCQRDDPDVNGCLTHAANHLANHFKEGIPELGVPRVEPIVIDEIQIALGSGPDGYRAIFRDIEAFGVSNLTITGVRPGDLVMMCRNRGNGKINSRTLKAVKSMSQIFGVLIKNLQPDRHNLSQLTARRIIHSIMIHGMQLSSTFTDKLAALDILFGAILKYDELLLWAMFLFGYIISTYEPDGLRRSDLDTLQFQISFFIPKISAQAKYRSSGVLIMVKASGGGEYWGEYEGVRAKVYFRAKPHQVGRHKYLSIEEIKMDFSVKDIKMGIKNIHNGNSVLEAALNLMINTHAQELLTEMKPSLRKELVSKMKIFTENIFARIPYDIMIIE